MKTSIKIKSIHLISPAQKEHLSAAQMRPAGNILIFNITKAVYLLAKLHILIISNKFNLFLALIIL